ncbi:protein of unknown function [Candidatus Nitrospira inopinata]|uniref:Uncharacterized protein n=1 Tax=Candidatus Nitrospira inopinata TaxID=1715989 RepID=A0A0S4KSN0_9BACT|nr:protein of unknown function [Candidatus Nitrospira inopinata]
MRIAPATTTAPDLATNRFIPFLPPDQDLLRPLSSPRADTTHATETPFCGLPVRNTTNIASIKKTASRPAPRRQMAETTGILRRFYNQQEDCVDEEREPEAALLRKTEEKYEGLSHPEPLPLCHRTIPGHELSVPSAIRPADRS